MKTRLSYVSNSSSSSFVIMYKDGDEVVLTSPKGNTLTWNTHHLADRIKKSVFEGDVVEITDKETLEYTTDQIINIIYDWWGDCTIDGDETFRGLAQIIKDSRRNVVFVCLNHNGNDDLLRMLGLFDDEGMIKMLEI